MLVLGIETSTKAGSFSLYSSKYGILSQINIQVTLNHSDTILRAIDNLINLAKTEKDSIDLIAVGLGPGSFTGVRVGMGVAKGLAYSLGKPMRGVNTLDILANKVARNDSRIVPLIDARNERAYYAFYKYSSEGILIRESEYLDDSIKGILEKCKGEKIVFTGDGSIKNCKLIEDNIVGEYTFVSKSQTIVDSAVLCEIAIKNVDDNLFALEPFYLSVPQAERMKSNIGVQ